MERNIRDVTLQQRNRLRFDYLSQEWLGKVPYTVLARTLDFITKQYRVMLGAQGAIFVAARSKPVPNPLEPCT